MIAILYIGRIRFCIGWRMRNRVVLSGILVSGHIPLDY